MKILHPLPLLLALLVARAEARDFLADLVFANGDRIEDLSGVGYENGHLVLEGDEVIAEAAKVRLDRVFELRLPPGALPPVEAEHVARLQLTNDDTIPGQLSSINANHVTLDTWFGGEMRIKRSMSGSLQITRSNPAIYVGPDSLEHWTVINNQDAWALRQHQLVSENGGSIARKIKLPDQCRITFDLAWRQSLEWRLLLFSNDGTTDRPENCYDVIFQRRFAYVRKRWMSPKSGGTRTVGRPATIPELSRINEARLEFFIDRRAGEFALYVDDRPVQLWVDEDPETGAFGEWIHLISVGQPLRISKMRAATWDGNLPDEVSPESRLTDEDLVINDVGPNEDGSLVVKTGDGEIEVPRDHGLTIGLSDIESPDYEEPIRRSNDVRAWLRGGGHITFQLRAFDGRSVTGYSQAFGEIKCDLRAFSHLDFNIYNEDRDSVRSKIEWDADE